MRAWARSWLGLICVFLVVGCGSSGEELSKLEQTASGLSSEVADLRTKVGTLEDSVTRLNDRETKWEGDYRSLSQTVENLADQKRQREGQYSTLEGAVARLELSYKQLTKKVTDAVANVTKSRSDAETRAPVSSATSTSGLQSDRNKLDGLRLTAPKAEVCEAIDKFTGQIDSIMRQNPSASTQSKMDEALADFKGVVNQFREYKDTVQILTLADELKWTAYNASKSRSYLAESGAEISRWKLLAKENESKLRGFCGR